MSTIVWFHAHPDDEAILTGGSMLRAAEEGHRNVLVVATNGDFGEVPDDLDPGETLVDRRRQETVASAAVLGVDRVVWLGYADSGMTGWEQNSRPDAFLQAGLDDAAQRLADVLHEESAEVLVTYDWHGNYGHPDHIKVHQVGHRAAELAGTPALFEATFNRDRLRAMAELANRVPPVEGQEPVDFEGDTDDGIPLGIPEAELTHEVDVSRFAAAKRTAVACHHSQVTDTSFLLRMPEEVFAAAFGTEWFIRIDAPVGMQQRWILDPD